MKPRGIMLLEHNIHLVNRADAGWDPGISTFKTEGYILNICGKKINTNFVNNLLQCEE